MNRLYYALGLFALLSGGLLSAQTVEATTTIPFDFRMGNKLMPAGNYEVSSNNEVLRLRKLNGAASAMVLTIPALRPHASAPSLEFHKYGQSYFLSRVWGPDQEGFVLKTSQTEKGLKEASNLVQTASAKLRMK